MSRGKPDITEDWRLYEAGAEYNHSLSPDYYANLNRNERFYAGDQWHGIKPNGLPVFTLNLFKRVINYFVSAIMSQAVKMQYSVDNVSDETEDEREKELKLAADYLSRHSLVRWENLKMDSLVRDALLDAALSGDMAAYTFWDDTIDVGQVYGDAPGSKNGEGAGGVPILGDFITEPVDGCNILFGNPNDRRVNVNGKPKQPYIIIAGRDTAAALREEARLYRKENGLSENDIMSLISPDGDNGEQAGDRSKKELDSGDDRYGRATFIIKLWPEKGSIYFNKSVRGAYLRKNVNSELTLYPVAWGNWDKRKNSYHGQAVGTGLIDNQIQINAGFAKVFKWMSDMAFPKIAYNRDLIPGGLTNRVGEIIPVDAGGAADLSQAVYPISPADMSAHVLDIINLAVNMTKEMMGANDAALGDVKPENTSAIIAVQKASAIPLENVKVSLYQFVEDLGYIWLDFMLRKYKVPRKIAVDKDGKREMFLFDPNNLDRAKFRIKVDVGPSSYWSEIKSVETLDNLFRNSVIDAVQLLKRYPEGFVPMKNELIKELEDKVKGSQSQEQSLAQVLGGAVILLREVRCKRCGRLLGYVDGGYSLWCRHCKEKTEGKTAGVAGGSRPDPTDIKTMLNERL